MFKKTVLAAALAAVLGAPCAAMAKDDAELQQIREQIRQMKDSYESRIQALEARLQQAEGKTEKLQAQSEQAPVQAAAVPAAAPASANAFNPSISLILGGSYARLSQDPSSYRIQGFLPGGDDVGPGKRSFNLGESELTFSANIDPQFAGQLTFSVLPDNSVSVEEAFVQTQGLAHGVGLKFGRHFSGVGYLNGQHAHTWDFVDAPLAYKAFFGGQYKNEGLQVRWLAPTERFFEIGAEAGRGATFPGNERNANGLGSTALFTHIGDDIGESASWRAGLSYLRNTPNNRSYSDTDSTGTSVTNAVTGRSSTWIADAIFKWSPNGNATQTNLKLQGEYFRRTERGTLTYDTQALSQGTLSDSYASAQSGWYLQSVYQFMPKWRAGIRYDRLYSGNAELGAVNSGARSAADFPRLTTYNPTRSTIMADYSPSEFSRFRLQFARDNARPGVTDNEIFLQYIMSLGTHGAHSF